MIAPTTYAIEVHGTLPSSLVAELEPFAVTAKRHTTVLVGDITDSAALYGLLARLEAIGVRLVSVHPVDPADTSRT